MTRGGGVEGASGADALLAAFREIGAPIRVLRPDSEDAAAVYGEGLLLVRPDLHIAWRGRAAPADPQRLASTVTGRLVA